MFPLIPLPYLRKKLAKLNGLYAPVFLEIRKEDEDVERGVGERMCKARASENRGGAGKGKGRDALDDEVFEEGRRWVETFIAGEG